MLHIIWSISKIGFAFWKNISKYFEIVPIIDPFGTEIEWENTVHLKKSEHFWTLSSNLLRYHNLINRNHIQKHDLESISWSKSYHQK